mmetsp:Transcript_23827/g.33385  ORF Transcript_23827/g.33385 Transcript_23827/m.33385 type:complete len:247 (+) Transcript_23827:258-998(+)
MLPSLSTEVFPRVHHDYTMPAFLSKPEPPPILPRISTITTLLSADVTSQAPKFPSPSSPITQPTKPWKREDDVNDVVLALEKLRGAPHCGRSSIPEMDPTLYSNDSDVSPPNESEDSLGSKKRPLAALVTPVVIAVTDIPGSFIKAKPKKKRRKAEQIDRKFPCDYPGCPKSYGSEGALKTHKRLKHPDLPSDQIPPQPQSTALQQVHAVQIHPSQLLHHNANGGSIVQLLPSPQVLHQQTSNTVA